EDRSRRIHPRQPGERDRRLVSDRISLREAPVAIRSEHLGRLGRTERPGSGVGALSEMRGRAGWRGKREAQDETRGSGHVPTPTRPLTGTVAAGLPPTARPHFFWRQPILFNFVE